MNTALEYLPGALILAGIAALILAPLASYRASLAQQAADEGEGRADG